MISGLLMWLVLLFVGAAATATTRIQPPTQEQESHATRTQSIASTTLSIEGLQLSPAPRRTTKETRSANGVLVAAKRSDQPENQRQHEPLLGSQGDLRYQVTIGSLELVESRPSGEDLLEDLDEKHLKLHRHTKRDTSNSTGDGGQPQSYKHKIGKEQIYTNQFVIQVQGGESEARKLAQKHGFVYLNHILDDFYHLEHKRLAKRSTSEFLSQASELSDSLQDEPQVLKLERQVLKRRVKRDFLELPLDYHKLASLTHSQAQSQNNQLRPTNFQGARPAANVSGNQLPVRLANQRPNTQTGTQSNSNIIPQHLRQPVNGPVNRIGSLALEPLEADGSASSAAFLYQQLAGRQRVTPNINSTQYSNSSQVSQPFNDPNWPLMWYLDGGARNGFDLNVQAAWRMGYTGKGIVVTILDDGLERDHPDLQANYDPLASFDINKDDADPMPEYDLNDSNRHGTRCAGEVAAVANNNLCSIGIAYNSKVGGVRMLDGDVTDAVEARSLGLNNQHIHIYSASWGPDDNGKTVDGPGEMATRAFIEGVTRGRQGLGSIFVFASGNGGREHDNCNCDGYTNSIWTLSISSATENGYVPWYIEACSSTLATTYSSGSFDERQIATTDLHHSCTSNHTGTSASAPLAAGICALVLESNPRLTWRDMQHIVVRTAKPANLVAKDWRTNALGRNVSHAFGYGLMDAAAMIVMAKRWTTVPEQYTCEVRSPPMEQFISAKGYIELKLRAECANVRYLEHVQSKVTLTASRRGDLHIYLTSPLGTRSTLLAQRPNDQAEQGFRQWPFMTVHSWGESPNGVWTLEIHNDGKPQNRAYLKEWTLVLYGTKEYPNRHLDSSSQSTQNVASQPTIQPSPRPPMKPTTSAPPPPISTSASGHQSDNRNQMDSVSPLWTQSPPVPPPVTTELPKVPARVQPTTTTTTSPTPSIIPIKTTVGTTTTNTTSDHQRPRPDFDIVSAPVTEMPKISNPNIYNQPTRLWTTEQPTSSSRPPQFVSQKPSISSIDGNKLDSALRNNSEPNAKPMEPTDTFNDHGLDVNQLDLKQTKDYRSSGGAQQADNHLMTVSSSPTPIEVTDTPGIESKGKIQVTSKTSSGQRIQGNSAKSNIHINLFLMIILCCLTCRGYLMQYLEFLAESSQLMRY